MNGVRKRLLVTGASLVLVAVIGAIPASRAHVSAGAPVFGALDFQQLAKTGLDFTVPPATVQPEVNEQQISAIAKQSPEDAEASDVRFQFLYLTTPINAISPSTVQSDPQLATALRTVGHPVNLPVWVVSFEGLTLPASQGSDVNHEDNEVLDAHSGQLVLGFTYR